MRELTMLEMGAIMTAVPFVFGVLFMIAMNFIRNKRDKEYKSCTKKVLARIEKIDEECLSHDDDGTEIYTCYPTYKYWAKDVQIEVRSKRGLEPGTLEIGDMVPIYYDPKDVRSIYCPDNEVEEQVERLQLFSTGCFVFSIICLICFILVEYVK